MAHLIVRNVDRELVRALRVRAAQKRRSAEAEHREILREALMPRPPRTTLKDLLLDMPAVGEDGDFERPRDVRERVEADSAAGDRSVHARTSDLAGAVDGPRRAATNARRRFSTR